MALSMPSKLPSLNHHAPPPEGETRWHPSLRQMPGLDDRLVEPEGRNEILRGRLLIAAPALPPHADTQSNLAYLVGGHIRSGFVGATELLTRAAVGSDFATDVCIRKAGIDPETGARHLEELAFEVVYTQSLRDITARAEDLSARGVRRIFAIFVQVPDVREWSPDRCTWQVLPPDAVIDDPCLSRPIPVRAVLDAAEADNAVARALIDRHNPVIEELRSRRFHEGEALGVRRGRIQGICEMLDIALTPDREAALQAMDAADLDALAARLKRDRRWR